MRITELEFGTITLIGGTILADYIGTLFVTVCTENPIDNVFFFECIVIFFNNRISCSQP